MAGQAAWSLLRYCVWVVVMLWLVILYSNYPVELKCFVCVS